MGPEGVRNRKKHPPFLFMPNFHKLQEDSKNESLKIGSKGPKKLGPFSLFLMRKTTFQSSKVVSKAIFPTN